jgi:hypothetical protein
MQGVVRSKQVQGRRGEMVPGDRGRLFNLLSALAAVVATVAVFRAGIKIKLKQDRRKNIAVQKLTVHHSVIFGEKIINKINVKNGRNYRLC